MGIFSGITAAFKTAETGAKVIDTATKGIAAGIDKSFYTDEEKADATRETLTIVQGFWKTYAGENTLQSRARRELARMTFAVFFFFLLGGAALYKVDILYAQFMLSLAGEMVWLVGMVAAAYFVPHQLSKIIKP